MNSTTLIVPTSTPSAAILWTASAINALPKSISLTSGKTSTVLPSGFTLYIPWSTDINAVVDASSLAGAFTGLASGTSTYIAAYSSTLSTPAALANSIVPVRSGQLLLIPVTGSIGSTVHISQFTSSVSAIHAAVSTGAAAGTSTTASAGVSSTRGATSSPSASAASTTATNAAASSTGTRSPSPSPSPSGISSGALAGGIVGALLGGLLVGALVAFFCFRRRASRRQSSQSKEDSVSSDKSYEKIEQPPVGAAFGDSSGWQKHLPQDKDDRTISQTFRSLFDQIDLHMDGHYEDKPAKPSSSCIKELEKLSGDDLPRMLFNADHAVPILQTILTRWIVHHISGRSATGASLLPNEFATIAKKNNWHMELDGRDNGASAEQRHGFPQAFSQWRRLTGFLSTNSRADQTFKADLSRKADIAVQSIDESFAPWASSPAKKADRVANLREILYQASDAGILLFTQPSTFTFDWSAPREADRTVVVSPALVKRLDENAKALAKAQVLVEAKQAEV